MPFHVALYEPEIPPNTGNIIRLCANTGARLHLIKPFGFEWNDTRLKRAGLDYHDLAHVSLYDNYADFQQRHAPARLFAITTKGSRNYTEVKFVEGDTLMFGPETRGLPDTLLTAMAKQQTLRIPMQAQSRSLNLANAVSVILFEAWRQIDFSGGC
ncbi:MAG: tRNA (uridine(34)/cytosine(34)/5-carboxymethylaminomethyluridine(34)-2'-O)-methyltransferase TrmL [Gammaproteobacteria bacterium]|nr:tRNA (uridine(34)/cytosine(34)/5-carboxymethylaminomethyluridine(34)-2'-O)-methyltransferase TrmL [Gammaproteobacteria bacterium]